MPYEVCGDIERRAASTALFPRALHSLSATFFQLYPRAFDVRESGRISTFSFLLDIQTPPSLAVAPGATAWPLRHATQHRDSARLGSVSSTRLSTVASQPSFETSLEAQEKGGCERIFAPATSCCHYTLPLGPSSSEHVYLKLPVITL